MRISFRQGIIRYPYSGATQQFLQVAGNYVTLSATNGPTQVTFAHRTANYYISEDTTISNAWGPFSIVQDYWLYWDINNRTGIRTTGHTLIQPIASVAEPIGPAEDQHWFDLTTNVMKVRNGSSWREVIRVFAAKYDGVSFYSVAPGIPNMPFAGSQVGLNVSTSAGTILYDDAGKPLKKTNGEFLTSEDHIFAKGAQTTVVTLEQSVLPLTAEETLSAFSVVKLSDFGKIRHATYEDVGTTIIMMITEDVLTNSVTGPVTQGVVTNPNWDWTTPGAELWVDNGLLVENDPHTTNNVLHPTSRLPVARVISPDSIYFEQGLGGKGEQGPPGSVASADASVSTKGFVKLTTAPAIPTSPIAVSDTDPRMTDARAPLVHTHSAAQTTLTPYGAISAANVQTGIQQLEDNKLAKAGGTMTGLLTLSGNPTASYHATTKTYVDSLVSGLIWVDPIHHVNLISDSLSAPPVTPEYSDVYIVKTPGSGVWTGLDNHVVVWNGATWTDTGLITSHPIGLRFGIAIETPTVPSGSFLNKKNQIATLASISPVTWSFYVPVQHNAIYVNNFESLHAYHQYVYDAAGVKWIEFGGPQAIQAGNQLEFVGNILNVVEGAGSDLDADTVDGSHASDFATVSHTHSTYVLKAGDTMTGALTLAADPVSNLQAATKQYVDSNAGGGEYHVHELRDNNGPLDNFMSAPHPNANGRWYPPINTQIESIRAYVDGAPVGDTIKINVKKNGIPITTTPLTINSGEWTSAALVPTINILTPTNYISYELIQYGYMYGGSIGTVDTLVGGTGYVDGTYDNIRLTGGTGGSSATANLTVVGGSVTSVTIVNKGGNYTLADVLSVIALGNNTGNGFSVTVATLDTIPTVVGSTPTVQLYYKKIPAPTPGPLTAIISHEYAGDRQYCDATSSWTRGGGHILVEGGTPPYTYLWSVDGAIPLGYTLNFDNTLNLTSTNFDPVMRETLGCGSGGTYIVRLTVTDAALAVATSTHTVKFPAY